MMYAKAAAAKKYRRIAKEAVEAQEIESAPWEEMGVDASFYHETKRRRDQDNAMASLKAAYDGIVDSGLISDDDSEHMKRTPPTFELDKNNPRVELQLRRIR